MPANSEPSRFRALRLLVGLLFVLTAISQARVQLIERAHILEQARKSRRFTLERTEQARRGTIFSADHKPLAVDDDRYELSLSYWASSDGKKRFLVPQSDAFFVDLAAASGIPATEFAQLAASGSRRGVWKQRMSGAQADAVRAVRTRWRADGVSLDYTGERSYPLGESAAGLVGRARAGVPEMGLEKGYDEDLAGKDGRTIGMVDRSGAFLPMRIDPDSTPKVDGVAITTTIDSALQQEATARLKIAVEAHKAERGVALVYDPRSGDVLAMANWPTFDPDDPAGATTVPEGTDYNTNYMGRLYAGSTFKTLTLALAMDLGLVHAGDHLFCRGELDVWGTMKVRCDLHHGSRAHGSITPLEAIAKSCNVSAATWAKAIGRDRFIAYMDDLGLLSKPGLGLPGEVPGSFVRDEYATGLQLAHFGFGQSVTVTPVALVGAFGMLANNGVRMAPRVVKKIGDRVVPSKEMGQVIRPETAQEILRYMEGVIETDSGTGRSLRIPGYRLAGKTGTAEKQGSTGYISNFVGFVPAEAPKAVILVMIDHPQVGGYYGATVAGPVFVDLARAVIRRFGIPESIPAELASRPSAGAPADRAPKRVPRTG